MYQTRLHPFFLLSLLSTLIVCPSTALGQSDMRTQSVQVYFDSDEDVLSADAQQSIRRAILSIQPAVIKRVHVQGHTDSDASDAYNDALSMRRAANASNYLVHQGVPSTMLHTEAFGETQVV